VIRGEDAGANRRPRDPEYYFVREQGVSVWVIVKNHEGRDYLMSKTDHFLPDNLLCLPECR
jgi:hypothetical protein